MYLARITRKGHTSYVIRQSYADGGLYKSRDLFNLGRDPARYIVQVGGSGYYYHDDIHEALEASGASFDQEQLDSIFYEFLPYRIQRVIDGFDRSRRRSETKTIVEQSAQQSTAHLFDKRRYHFLRFGHSEQRDIGRVSDRVFRPLFAKSRDELEQYFLKEERLLRTREKPLYVMTIFELNQIPFNNDRAASFQEQMDVYFISQLCRLNDDHRFWAEVPEHDRLNDYLVKYAVMYFDYDPPRSSPWQAYVEDFIRRHRTYHPPRKVKIKLEEAGRLFGMPWKELKTLDSRSLTRLYRKLALTHHPDKGGDTETFRKLTDYYKVLIKKR